MIRNQHARTRRADGLAAARINFIRQRGLFSPRRFATPITVIGAGALGSHVVCLLTKMGCRRVTVYDPDTVVPHNLPNQVYGRGHVGRLKVEALRELVRAQTGVNVRVRPVRFADGPLRGVVFVLVDSMRDRAHIWEHSIRGQRGVNLLVEARMGAEGGRVYIVRPRAPMEAQEYQRTLYADEEAVENPCTRQAIAPAVAVLAGMSVFGMLNALEGRLEANEVIISFRPLVMTHQSFTKKGGYVSWQRQRRHGVAKPLGR